MQFTYEGYQRLLGLLKEHSYKIADYETYSSYDKCVILRHDIDNDIEKSLKMAEIEASCSVNSTYFVLLTSDFYNVFSKKNTAYLREIINCGHKVGLHFDELRYPEIIGDASEIRKKIMAEASILESVIEQPVKSVSMHRPSRAILESDLTIPGIINSYGKTFFQEFKYISDSRRNWREPVDEIIASETFQRLHILTHAFWYNETEVSLKDSVSSFIAKATEERYDTFANNFTNLDNVVKIDEI